MSGRPESFLKKEFRGVNCYLAFEHGAQLYDYRVKKVRNLVTTSKVKWYYDALEVIRDYTKRTPNII